MANVACVSCGGDELYRTTKPVSAGGGYAPNLLPGLGRWYSEEKLYVIICAQCGLTQLFARHEALEKLPSSSKWERI